MDDTKTIAILGKTGVGKSSLANTIFGKNLFEVGHSFNSQTRECSSVKDRRITIIDIPGFFDTDRPEEELKAEIVRCITECSPGVHAFIIVLKVEKFTEQEQAVITKIKEYFSEDALKYATVVFTHGDQLNQGETIMDRVKQNQPVSDLVEKCGGRCHVFDNKYWNKKKKKKQYRSNQFQVEELFKSIDKIFEANKRTCYTNEMLKIVEEKIQQEQEHIRQSSQDMSEEEIREQAENNVFQKILIKLAGLGTGVLLGALFGVTVISMLLKPEQEIAAGAAAVIRLGSFEQVSTAMGALTGGGIGITASDGAETVQEAATKATEAVKNAAISVIENVHAVIDRLLRREPRVNT